MDSSNKNKSPGSDNSKAGLYVVLAFLLGLPIVGLLVQAISNWLGE